MLKPKAKSREYQENLATQTTQNQYSFWQIIAIWALAAVPMFFLAWIVAPAVIPNTRYIPGVLYWVLMIAGMFWQFLVSIAIIYSELGTLRWSTIRQRTWLQLPLDPTNDQPNPKLFWWLIPAIFFSALVGLGFSGYLDAMSGRLFPALQPSVYQDSSQLAYLDLKGQWWLLGIALVSGLFNYFLGEEFLFRGVLLPKMRMVFGKYDWVANAVLFGLYHLHKPWSILTNILGSLAITWPASRFRSNWMAIIVHGVEGVFMLVSVLAVILGISFA